MLPKTLFRKFLLISFLVTDRGLVEILNLHRKKWKNEKIKNIVFFPIQLQREQCLSKCKFSLYLAFSEFRPQEMKKKCRQKFTEKSFSCLYSWELHSSNFILSQNMMKMYKPSVFRDNMSTKSITSSLLSW